MSVWTTQTLDRDHNYIVLQHTIKGTNHTINGIKFRAGYCVVEKDSKTYFALKKIPVLRNSKEFPLTHLKKLPFITRTSDIRTVFGQDVYVKFLSVEEQEIKEQKEKEKQELLAKQKLENERREAELQEKLASQEPIKLVKCCFRTQDDTLCDRDATDISPSNYCQLHIHEDPRLPEFGLVKPKYMTKDELNSFKNKVRSVLQKAKNANKF